MDIYDMHERWSSKKWFSIIATSVFIALGVGETLLFGDVADLFSRPEPAAFFVGRLWLLVLVAVFLSELRTQVYFLGVYKEFAFPKKVTVEGFFRAFWHPRAFRLLLDTFLQQIFFMLIIESLRSRGIAPVWVLVILGLFVIPYYFVRGLFYEYTNPVSSLGLLHRFIWWFVGGIYYGLLYYWSGGVLLPWAMHFIRNFSEWVLDSTPVQIVLQINGAVGRVYIEGANGNWFSQTYTGGAPDEWITLEGKCGARGLAAWASKHYGVPTVEDCGGEDEEAEVEVAVGLS